MVLPSSLRWLGFCVWALCALSLPNPSAQRSLQVAWTAERLTVSARDVPFVEMLAEVARRTGVEFVGAERLTEPVSIEFSDKSLDDGLKELLAPVDYLIAAQRPGSPSSAAPVRIFVLPRGHPRSPLPQSDAVEDLATSQLDHPTTDEPVDADTEPAMSLSANPSDEARDPEVQRLDESGFFDEANASALVDASHHPNASVRIRAMEVLSQRDAALSADVVADAMTDGNPSVSSAAAVLIAENGDLRAVERLGQLLKHDDPVVRFDAIQLLAQRGDAACVPYVLQAAEDENAAVRVVARQLLRQLERTHFRP
jgi:HEAT repeat protein